MKATKILLAFAVLISGAAIAADNHDTKPLHGKRSIDHALALGCPLRQ